MSLTQQKLSPSILSFLAHAGRLSIILPLLVGGMAHATQAERDQARRMHDRLAGVPPSNKVLEDMELIITADPIGAAEIAMENPAFYNVTLKNYVAPWTNEDQSVFVPLNDYTATVIGIIRDNIDFRQILSGDIIYTGNTSALGLTSYSSSNNQHYLDLEALGPVAGNLADVDILKTMAQSETVSGITSDATAGVITTRAAAKAFFTDGTNRSMFRFTLINHLCTDLEPLKDVSRVPDRVRQDVSRSPGGDSRIYMFSCVGCHAGMDGLTGAYSQYNFNTNEGQQLLDYAKTDMVSDISLNGFSATGISNKYSNNADNFKPGYTTTDNSWINYWRNGPNSLLGWDYANDSSPSLDQRGHSVGEGAKSMGVELANSKAFASCQVKKAFKAVCFRDPGAFAADRAAVNNFTQIFRDSNYKMKSVFANVAAYCSQ